MSPLVSTFAGAALRPYGFTVGAGGGAAFELISTQVLASTATSVTFSSIPSTYKHLQLRWTARVTNADNNSELKIQFNGDTASNYSNHLLVGDGTTVTSSSALTSSMRYGALTAATSSASIFGAGVIDILNHADTNTYKTLRQLSGRSQTTSPSIRFNSSSWRSTAAISSIVISDFNSTSFVVGSRFSLYGIRG